MSDEVDGTIAFVSRGLAVLAIVRRPPLVRVAETRTIQFVARARATLAPPGESLVAGPIAKFSDARSTKALVAGRRSPAPDSPFHVADAS